MIGAGDGSGCAAFEELATITEHAPEPLYLVRPEADGSYRFVHANAAFLLLAGCDRRTVDGATVVEVLGADWAASLGHEFRRCIDGGVPVECEERISRNGQTIFVQTLLSPIADESRVTAIVGASRDVTASRETENELRYLSEVDALTGVPNRRKTSEELDRELVRARRHGHPLSVAILDIDRFKVINDSYGHDTGDSVLCGVVAAVNSTLRPSDRVGRWGGEEFVAILPETNRQGALAVAERVRSAVELAQVLPDRAVTVSIGVASMAAAKSRQSDSKSATVRDLLRVADEELYRAKEGGRNRVAGALEL